VPARSPLPAKPRPRATTVSVIAMRASAASGTQWSSRPAGSSRRTALIVGTAVVSHLTDVQRIDKPRKPRGMPQPVWFGPF
jgi:hypothetical protein